MASDRRCQSEAAAVPLDDASPDFASLFDSVVDAGFDSPSDFAAFFGAVALRSFFAQPDPLKTIAGGANDFRIDPSVPHSGQKCGPASWTPWRISVRWLQAEQTYS
jgi:hypothetical protein